MFELDILFQVLLPELKDLEGLKAHQEIYQGPVTYRWGQHVELAPYDVQSYVLKMLPKGIVAKEWVFYDIVGDGLGMLESEINGVDVAWDGKRLDDFLEQLLRQYDRWVFVFEPHYDQIDGVYELTADECLGKLRTNLRRDITREGFIAYSAGRG
ncbi:MAG: hypothetical protein ABIV21_06845 [Pyrinomonadaceae bacterium]